MFSAAAVAEFGRLAGNHLWQSTVFGAAAALLALTLRGNRASVRHWLWLAASVKFLVPFAGLAVIGGWLGRWVVPAGRTAAYVPVVVGRVVEPFAGGTAGVFVPQPVPVQGSGSWVWPVLIAVWALGLGAVAIYSWRRWRRVARVVRGAVPITAGREMMAWRRIQDKKADQEVRPALVCSAAALEPGVFGIFRPLIWLPAGIGDRLSDSELEAILAHELCHVWRRDNLTSFLHMVVECLFWFHPLVWWMGARLTEERELACDEEVVRMGGSPQVYAESILKVCEHYLASPVACAAGVTG
ncbi:MAG TPA: M56 family metallopeptidase, partial [Bryobacteraceae bacterium]|nr:M56 family metallopeptidase [Bryobacteraceae bacterium]